MSLFSDIFAGYPLHGHFEHKQFNQWSISNVLVYRMD